MACESTRAPIDGPLERAVGARTGALFSAHGRMVFAVCRSMLRDSGDAEDATQAAFLSAHEALAGGSEISDPGAWLATIARNECRARLRGRSCEPLELYTEVLADPVTTDDVAERRATVAHLRSEIAALPERQREAVVLRDLYGLSYGEVCVALGISRPSVEALLFRARRTLRVRLRPMGGAAIVVPAAVREGIAQAVPFFAQSSPAAVAAAVGAGAIGKLTWPAAAKIAVGVVAVGVTGHAVVERAGLEPSQSSRAANQVEPRRLQVSTPGSSVPAKPRPAAPTRVALASPTRPPAVEARATAVAPAVPVAQPARSVRADPTAGRATGGQAAPVRVSATSATRSTTAPTRARATSLRTPEPPPTRAAEPDRVTSDSRVDAPARSLSGDPPTRVDDPATTTVETGETGARVEDLSPTPVR